MLEFNKPIPVVVEGNKEGYALYVSNGGTFENDVWCVVHCEGGIVRHYTSDQIRIYHNATFGIKSESKGYLAWLQAQRLLVPSFLDPDTFPTSRRQSSYPRQTSIGQQE